MNQIGSLAHRLLGHLCVSLLACTVVLTIVQVFWRYALNQPLSWSEEVARWIFVWAIFLGSAWLMGEKKHMRLEFFTERLSPKALLMLAFFGHAVTAASCWAMLIHGWDFCSRVTGSSAAMEWPSKYLYMGVPVGAAITLLYLAAANPLQHRWRASGALAVAAGYLLFSLILSATPWVKLDWSVGWSVHILALGLMFLDVPIAYAMVFAVYASFSKQGDLMLLPISQTLTTSVNSFLLLSIPFFILAAHTMNAGGITHHLVRFAQAFVGHFRGGLAQVNVLTNTVMGGLSGSSLAVAVGTAKVMIPEMEKRGYSRPFAAAITSCASTIDNLIPPSIGMIVFAASAMASVGALFTAGIVPGLMMAAALMWMVHVQAGKRGLEAAGKAATWAERGVACKAAVPALMVPLFIVGGMRGGAFTASEAGAIAVLYAILIGTLGYRTFRLKELPGIFKEGLTDTVAVIAIVAASAPFGWALGIERVPQKIAEAMAFLADNKWLFLLVMNVFLLIVGLAMEFIASIVILTPILLPLATLAGIDPIHLGVIMVMNLVLGALTPPLGVLIFATANIAKVRINDVYRESMPFFWALIGVLVLVTYVPWFSSGIAKLAGY